MPPPVNYFTNTQRLNRPWRQRIGALATAFGPDPADIRSRDFITDEEEDDPLRRFQQRSTYGAEIASRLGNRGATTSGLRPSGPTSVTTAGSQSSFGNPFMQQLQQISKMGTQATDIVQARNAFRSAQNVGGGGGGFNIGNASGKWGTILKALKSQIGVPYVWGGEQPGRGFDCSGLVQWAYRRAGIRLPRVSQQQMRTGVRVPIRNLVPGDLVGWGSPATHIAVYIGNGRVIEAPYTGARVRVRKLSQKGPGAWGIHLRGM